MHLGVPASINVHRFIVTGHLGLEAIKDCRVAGISATWTVKLCQVAEKCGAQRVDVPVNVE